jgi:CubicO group peptidase (beta-lactamase class C family)
MPFHAMPQCNDRHVISGTMMRARSMLWLLLIMIAPLAHAAPPPSTAAPATLPGLDGYVHKVMRDWHVPGLAIAIVKDGKVVLARGYGVRELGQPGKVDTDTLFDIGSNSKAFTAAALGTLVASGKLEWDTPVVTELPYFKLQSAYITQSLTLRDLLTHRSGYCDPSIAWFTNDADGIVRRLRYQKPEYGFRTTFCYNNVQYLMASRFIPATTGTNWNDYVAAHLFKPLDMNRTVSTDAAVDASNDVAAPHGMIDDKPAVIHRYWPHNMDVFAAVGGIWSSANDMSHWLQMLLADGKYDGRTVLDPAALKTMQTPQILIAADTGVGKEIRAWMPGGTFYTYGFGLFVQDDDDHTLVWHAGDIDGMASAVVLAPDSHLGIVVLSNMDHANAHFAIVARVLQEMLGLPQHDIEPVLLADSHKHDAEDAATEKKLADTRVRNGKPPLSLQEYAGTYANKLDGSAHVVLENGHLILRLGNPDFSGALQPWHGNTFHVTWRNKFYGDDYVTFDVDALEKPVRLSLTEMPLQFERVKSDDGSNTASE